MNIVVTGTSRGIGYEIVKNFARTPENHVVALSRNLEGLNRLKRECRAQNKDSRVFPVQFDLDSNDYSESLLGKLQNYFEKVDILVNNAGYLVNKPFIEITEREFDRLFHTNVKGVVKLIQLLFPYFSKTAHIVNIGSMGGVQGSMKFPGLSLYSTSKGALAILSECLAEEFKETGIRVNCLALGAARTEMLMQAFPNYEPPLSAEQIAEFICDFALRGHRYFNGKIIPVALSTP